MLWHPQAGMGGLYGFDRFLILAGVLRRLILGYRTWGGSTLL